MKAQVIFNNDVDDFVELTRQCSGDVVIKRGKFCVDGKSLVGVIYITSYNEPVTIEYDADDSIMSEWVETHRI